MFKDSIFNPNETGWLLAILLWILCAMLFAILLYGVVWCIDNINMPRHTGTGVVVEKTYTPAHVTYTHHKIGDSYIQTPVYHDETFSLTIALKEGSDVVYVPQDYYNAIHTNNSVQCKYVLGRLTNSVYIKSIE